MIELHHNLQRLTEFLMDERDHQDPHSINCGDCWLWALLVKTVLPDAILHAWSNGGHIWIEYQGKYYDSEKPEGVEEWSELNIFQYWSACEEEHEEHLTVSEIRARRFNYMATDAEFKELCEKVKEVWVFEDHPTD